jgi:hypothetical protein
MMSKRIERLLQRGAPPAAQAADLDQRRSRAAGAETEQLLLQDLAQQQLERRRQPLGVVGTEAAGGDRGRDAGRRRARRGAAFERQQAVSASCSRSIARG